MLEKFEKAGSAFIGLGILWYAQDRLFNGHLKETISSTVNAVGKVGEFAVNTGAFLIQHPEFACLAVGVAAIGGFVFSSAGRNQNSQS